MRVRDRNIRIFRQVRGSTYYYYIQEGETTVLWYPEMTWQSRDAPQPEGRLLAEGSVERVMSETRELLPADLCQEIWKSIRGDGDDGELRQNALQGGVATTLARVSRIASTLWSLLLSCSSKSGGLHRKWHRRHNSI